MVRAPVDMLVMVRDVNPAVAVKIIHVHLVSRADWRSEDEQSMNDVKSAENMCSVVQLQIVHYISMGTISGGSMFVGSAFCL